MHREQRGSILNLAVPVEERSICTHLATHASRRISFMSLG